LSLSGAAHCETARARLSLVAQAEATLVSQERSVGRYTTEIIRGDEVQ